MKEEKKIENNENNVEKVKLKDVDLKNINLNKFPIHNKVD